jgi:hypothetical protein
MRLVLAVSAALLALAAGLGVAGLGRGSPDELLPDLDQAVPSAVAIRREDGRDLLVFASAVDNVGRGPLLVEASRESRADETMSASQLVLRGDGSSARRALAETELRYERAETHAHWHLHGFERYELRDARGRALLTARKAGFCLGDRYDSRGSARLPGEPADAVWTEECGKGEPELLELLQGISVGYGDDYAPFLEGQFVDVTDLPAGRYLLVHLVNPGRFLREAEHGNNAASVLVELRRLKSKGRVTVRVLERCPDTARCPS